MAELTVGPVDRGEQTARVMETKLAALEAKIDALLARVNETTQDEEQVREQAVGKEET